MMVWKYTIQSNAGVIITQNADYAEEKSRLGNIVFCKRENNVYKFNHQMLSGIDSIVDVNFFYR